MMAKLNQQSQTNRTTGAAFASSKFLALFRVLWVVVTVATVYGCSSDGPTQGKPVTVTQMRSDIDDRLNQLETIPLNKRYIAKKMLDKGVYAQGTKAQQDRYKELMKNAPIPGPPIRTMTPAMSKVSPAQPEKDQKGNS